MNVLKLEISALRKSIAKFVHSGHLLLPLAILVLTGTGLNVFLVKASGDQILPQRSVTLASSIVSAVTDYKLSFTISTPGALGSIEFQFCSNDPIPQDPCVAPIGLDLSSAVLSVQTGETGFSISGASTTNKIILTRPATAATAQPVSYTLSGVTNPSAIGSYYGRIQTFASSDASGTDINYGGLAFAMTDAFTIRAKVPPYLLFCSAVSIPSFDCSTATGNYISFGNFSSKATSTGQTQMLAATNAASGYSIDYGGTTLTSGNNIIPGLSTADVSRPGVSQFGLNLVANQIPAVGQDVQGPGSATVAAAYAQPNVYKFVDNDVVATATGSQYYREYTVSYIANIAPGQAPGVYDSTITYVCLANF